MARRDLGGLLATLMPVGLIGVSTALAPPAEAAPATPAVRENDDVAARLDRVRAAVATVTIEPAAGDANVQQAWWGNGGWRNGGWGWRNGGGWGWHNGGWGNGHPWGNGWHNGGWGNGWHNGGWGNGWHNGGWGNWHPWLNL